MRSAAAAVSSILVVACSVSFHRDGGLGLACATAGVVVVLVAAVVAESGATGYMLVLVRVVSLCWSDDTQSSSAFF